MTVGGIEGSVLSPYFTGNGRVYEMCTRQSASQCITFTDDAGSVDVPESKLYYQRKISRLQRNFQS